MDILIINGPNLNLLGFREPGIYGNDTLESINAEIAKKAKLLDFDVEFFQSNHEGEIIDKLHEARNTKKGVILNAGAYTHYSYAIRDAIAAIKIPVVEVHLSNVDNREEFRKESVIAPVCVGSISGFGKNSYILGLYGLRTAIKN
ncbi:MAG: type II 3-dehydroquinate dehydratase [Ruminiclostridium sp.]